VHLFTRVLRTENRERRPSGFRFRNAPGGALDFQSEGRLRRLFPHIAIGQNIIAIWVEGQKQFPRNHFAAGSFRKKRKNPANAGNILTCLFFAG